MRDITVSKEIENQIINLFSKEDFLLYLEEYNIRDTKNKSYSEITKDACRYGIMYMILAISKKIGTY